MINKQVSEAVALKAEEFKKLGFEVTYTKIAGREFLFRPIVRSEWKLLLKKRNEAMKLVQDDDVKKAEVLEQELENLLSVSLLYPKDNLDTIPAGAIQTLADAVMVASGFAGVDTEPIKL